MRSVQENMNVKDDFSVYGENVANRTRGANQNVRAISIAKNRIDNILFQLEMGAQTQIIWQSPESQQPQSQIAFPQQSSDIAELNEYLVRRANFR